MASDLEFLTKQTFLDKIFDYENNKEWNYKGELPAIIDFYADWCGPCRMVGPIMEQLSSDYKGKVNIFKIDTDAEQELASIFGIRSIPSVLFIPVDDKPQMSVGAMSKESYEKAISDLFKVEKSLILQ